MKAEIIAVGTELLIGQIVDTNSSKIAVELSQVGVDCLFHTCVGDNIDRIVSALSVAASRVEVVIVCGGLGPTTDDLTREAVCHFGGVKARQDDNAARLISEFFARRNRQMPAVNLKQADVPEGAEVIYPTRGTAPGLIVTAKGIVLYALPGVPDEMLEMLSRAVLPDIINRQKSNEKLVHRVIHTFGIGESTINEMLGDLVAKQDDRINEGQSNVATIAFLANLGNGTKIRLTAKQNASEEDRSQVIGEEGLNAPTSELMDTKIYVDAEPETARQGLEGKVAHDVAELEATIVARLGEYVYGFGSETLESRLADLCKRGRIKFAICDSASNGELVRRICGADELREVFCGATVGRVKHSSRGGSHRFKNPYQSSSRLNKGTSLSLSNGAEGIAFEALKSFDADIGVGLLEADKTPGITHVSFVTALADVESFDVTWHGPSDQNRIYVSGSVLFALGSFVRRIVGDLDL